MAENGEEIVVVEEEVHAETVLTEETATAKKHVSLRKSLLAVKKSISKSLHRRSQSPNAATVTMDGATWFENEQVAEVSAEEPPEITTESESDTLDEDISVTPTGEQSRTELAKDETKELVEDESKETNEVKSEELVEDESKKRIEEAEAAVEVESTRLA